MEEANLLNKINITVAHLPLRKDEIGFHPIERTKIDDFVYFTKEFNYYVDEINYDRFNCNYCGKKFNIVIYPKNTSEKAKLILQKLYFIAFVVVIIPIMINLDLSRNYLINNLVIILNSLILLIFMSIALGVFLYLVGVFSGTLKTDKIELLNMDLNHSVSNIVYLSDLNEEELLIYNTIRNHSQLEVYE